MRVGTAPPDVKFSGWGRIPRPGFVHTAAWTDGFAFRCLDVINNPESARGATERSFSASAIRLATIVEASGETVEKSVSAGNEPASAGL